MKTNSYSNLSLKTKIVTGFSLALIVISVIGYTTFQSHSKLTSVIIRQATPDFKLYKLKQILSNITDADASMHLYSLTEDETYLNPYLNLVNTIDSQIDTISLLTKDSPSQLQRVDSIQKLIQLKLFLMDKTLAVQNNGRTRDVLQEVINTIDKEDNNAKRTATQEPKPEVKTNTETADVDTTTVLPKPKPERSIWKYVKKMFSKTKKDSLAQATAKTGTKHIINLPPPPPEPVPEEIPQAVIVPEKKVKNVLAAASVKDKLERHKQSTEELSLSQQGQVTMYNIRVMIAEMEHEEIEKAKVTVNTVLLQANKTNRLITILFIIAALALVLFLIIIINDIKKNAIYNRALQIAKINSDQLAQAKQSFLANMSHEIRTPLNAIVGFSEQLNKSSLNRSQSQQANTIKQASQHLLSIVNDILDYAKIESGKISLESIPFSVSTILQDVCAMLHFEAERKGIELNYAVDENVPAYLIGDPLRIRQIIINLCSNAIKFTDEGSVKIHTAAVLLNDKAALAISVTDTGIGIAPNRINSIFEEFSQADNTISRRYGGTGLGLTLCKLLAEAQHGSIKVESETGKGSVFTVNLLLPVGSETFIPSAEIKPAVNLDGLKMLVADDEEFNRALLCTILNNQGVITDTAENGEQALALYKSNAYDLVLLDWQMPVMNGYEVLQRIKAEQTSTKVIAVTAINKAALRDDADMQLADGLLSKPFREDELFNILESILNASKKDNEIKEYHIDTLLSVCGNDAAFAANLLGIFIKNSRIHLQDIQLGADEDNWIAVAALAHKMLPSCRHLGLTVIINELLKLEAHTQDKEHLVASVNIVQEHFKTILPQLETEQKTILANII